MEHQMNVPFLPQIKCYQIISVIAIGGRIPFPFLGDILVHLLDGFPQELDFCFKRMIELLYKLFHSGCGRFFLNFGLGRCCERHSFRFEQFSKDTHSLWTYAMDF